MAPSSPRTYQTLFRLRAVQVASPPVYHWLSNTTTLTQVQERFETCLSGDKWRLELRIRCVPSDLHELYEKDKATFVFYYDQVRHL